MANSVQQGTGPNTAGMLVQRVLAAVVRTPGRPLDELTNEVFAPLPDLPPSVTELLFQAVQHYKGPKARKSSTGSGKGSKSKVAKASELVPPPTIV